MDLAFGICQDLLKEKFMNMEKLNSVCSLRATSYKKLNLITVWVWNFVLWSTLSSSSTEISFYDNLQMPTAA
jgi:hypothetical protein